LSAAADLSYTQVNKTANQSLTSQAAGSDTKVTWNASPEYIKGSAVSWDSANNRYVINKRVFGRFETFFEFETNSSGFRRALIKKNSTTISRDTRESNTVFASVGADTFNQWFEVGDLIEVFATQNSGGALNIAGTGTNYFTFEEKPHTNVALYPKVSEIKSALSSVFTSPGSGSLSVYPSMTGNSLTLPPGTWELNSKLILNSLGGTHQVNELRMQWSTVNGNGTSTVPTAITTLHGVPEVFRFRRTTEITNNNFHSPGATIIFKNTSSQTIYLTPFVSTPSSKQEIALSVELLAKLIGY
jgi:hypothetical protein